MERNGLVIYGSKASFYSNLYYSLFLSLCCGILARFYPASIYISVKLKYHRGSFASESSESLLASCRFYEFSVPIVFVANSGSIEFVVRRLWRDAMRTEGNEKEEKKKKESMCIVEARERLNPLRGTTKMMKPNDNIHEAPEVASGSEANSR